MIDLTKFNENCSCNERPIYKKRYKSNGEEYLKQVDSINIEEDMKEKQLEIERIKEIFNTQERLKAEELLDDLTNEEFLNTLKAQTQDIQQLDTYEFLNRINELKEFYNKMPQDIRMKYKNINEFAKNYLPSFIDEKLDKIAILKQQAVKAEQTQKQNENLAKTQEELQKQIEELQKQLKGAETNV